MIIRTEIDKVGIMPEKRCTECKKVKDLSEFHNNKRQKNGKTNRCGPCLNARSRELREEASIAPKVKSTKALPLKIPKSKLLCEKNGQLIRKADCIPSCNDACQTCKSIQMGNLGAINNISPEEERESKYSGAYRSSAAIAVEDGYRDI